MKKAMLAIVLLLLAASVPVMAQQSAPTATSAPAAAEPVPAPSLTLSRMETAANVMDRKPVDVSATFTAAQDKVYCYLEFKDVKKESAVNVVWTLGQNEMGKTQLTIKPYPKFRTWANKSINGMKGDWKVDVLDEKGVLLKSASFAVQ